MLSEAARDRKNASTKVCGLLGVTVPPNAIDVLAHVKLDNLPAMYHKLSTDDDFRKQVQKARLGLPDAALTENDTIEAILADLEKAIGGGRLSTKKDFDKIITIVERVLDVGRRDMGRCTEPPIEPRPSPTLACADGLIPTPHSWYNADLCDNRLGRTKLQHGHIVRAGNPLQVLEIFDFMGDVMLRAHPATGAPACPPTFKAYLQQVCSTPTVCPSRLLC